MLNIIALIPHICQQIVVSWQIVFAKLVQIFNLCVINGLKFRQDGAFLVLNGMYGAVSRLCRQVSIKMCKSIRF